jgi:hypothetical protein
MSPLCAHIFEPCPPRVPIEIDLWSPCGPLNFSSQIKFPKKKPPSAFAEGGFLLPSDVLLSQGETPNYHRR